MGLPEEDRTGEPNNHCEVILESFLQNELRHIEEARREATLKLEELDLQIKRIRGKISELWVDDDLTKFLSDEEQVRIGRVSVLEDALIGLVLQWGNIRESDNIWKEIEASLSRRLEEIAQKKKWQEEEARKIDEEALAREWAWEQRKQRREIEDAVTRKPPTEAEVRAMSPEIKALVETWWGPLRTPDRSNSKENNVLKNIRLLLWKLRNRFNDILKKTRSV